jgi:hypothetical protein
MTVRNANIVATAIAFSVAVALAAFWTYLFTSFGARDASVEVEQVPDRSWAVEVQEVTPNNDRADERDKIVVAQGQ